jgi:hypothetical protein
MGGLELYRRSVDNVTSGMLLVLQSIVTGAGNIN